MFLDWDDKDIRHMDEAYIAASVVLVLFMVLGAIFLL